MRSLATVIAVVVALFAAGCAADDPPDLSSAVLRVTLGGCELNSLTQATAVAVGDGLALTVAHSFDRALTASVTDASGAEAPVELVFVDRDRDIALISFPSAGIDVETLELRDDGDDPAGSARTVLFRDGVGLVEAVDVLRRTSVTLDGVGERDGMEISGSISSGDSGAPVVDDRGRVIAMVFARSRGEGTGWAIAASELVGINAQAGDPMTLTC